MKVIILAAGQGSRLRPLTNDRPKSMVELASKPLLIHQLEVMKNVGISRNDIAIVTGHCREHHEDLGYKTFFNENYETTNMVYSLFCASGWMDEDQDLLIAYGDIVYDQPVLQKLINTDGEIVLAADLLWQKLWAARAEDYLADAETFRISANGFVSELGKRPSSIDDVEAQYMGLIKIRADKIADLKSAFRFEDTFQRDSELNNMYMTDFINDLILDNWKIMPALVEGMWLEVDTISDIELYKSMLDPDHPTNLDSVYQQIFHTSMR